MGSILGIKMSQCFSHERSKDIGCIRYHMDQFGAEESSMSSMKVSLHEDPEMTKEQVLIVTQTWDILKRDYDYIGVITFIGLFHSHPEVQDVFETLRGLPPAELNTKLLPHGLVIMAGLDSAIKRLSQPQTFASYMKDFSIKHAGFMSNADYLDYFPPEFLCAAQTCLKDGWTREMESAWICFLQIILYYMKKAIKVKAISNKASIRQ